MEKLKDSLERSKSKTNKAENPNLKNNIKVHLTKPKSKIIFLFSIGMPVSQGTKKRGLIFGKQGLKDNWCTGLILIF